MHVVLDAANIKLSSAFTDIFGKSGIELVNGLISGRPLEAIIGDTDNNWIKKRSEEIKNTGKITKRGSKHLRWILVEVAQAAIKVKRRTKLKTFIQRIKTRQGFKKAIVALARKILCILHHLLTNREPYKENDETPIKNIKLPKDKASAMMTTDEMIKNTLGCRTCSLQTCYGVVHLPLLHRR